MWAPRVSHFRSCGPGASAAPWWPRRPRACPDRGEKSAAPLKQEARNPRQEACLSPPPPQPPPQPPPPPPPPPLLLLHSLRLSCRLHLRSAPAAALLRPGAGDFQLDLLRLLLPEDHPSPSPPTSPPAKGKGSPRVGSAPGCLLRCLFPRGQEGPGVGEGHFPPGEEEGEQRRGGAGALGAPAGPVHCERLCPARFSQFPCRRSRSPHKII